jgi:hypothetical protein
VRQLKACYFVLRAVDDTGDLNELLPGNFDLGGLILERLFGIEYHEPQFAFKLHRLT